MEQKNKPLLVAGVLLALVIVIVIGVTVLPRFFYKPAYGFLYTYERWYYSPEEKRNDIKYFVEQGKIQQSTLTGTETTGLYIYDVKTNRSREITFAEAQKLQLDQNEASPDGFEVKYGSRVNGDFIFFLGGTDYESQYLVGHNAKHKINLINPDSKRFYDTSFKFLGWVME